VITIVLVVVLYPLYQTLILSLLPMEDIETYINQVENRGLRFIPSYFWPQSISFGQYSLTMNDTFLRAYAVAIAYVMLITGLHFPIAFVLGFVFAKVNFPGRDVLFFCFIATMVLPFHVTLIPLHQLLHHLHLFDTPWAVILPSAFSPLGVFLMRQFLSQIPNDVLEAASLDGAGLWHMTVFMLIPLVRNGLSVFFLLTISLQWSSIEPVLAFIRNNEWQPISLLLRQLMDEMPSQIFAPSVIYVIPMILLFTATSSGVDSEWKN